MSYLKLSLVKSSISPYLAYIFGKKIVNLKTESNVQCLLVPVFGVQLIAHFKYFVKILVSKYGLCIKLAAGEIFEIGSEIFLVGVTER